MRGPEGRHSREAGQTGAVGRCGGWKRRFMSTYAVAVSALTVACGGDDSPTASEEDGPPDRTAASIELLTDSVRPMGILGGTFRARARGRNAAGEITTGRLVTWSTSTPEILEVTPEGEVTSLSEGEGRVIARLDGVDAVMRVPVREVARLEWKASLGGQGTPSPMIGPEGTVYAVGLGEFDWF